MMTADLSLFHQTIIERMNALVAFLAPDGTILFWNVAAGQITGYPAGEVIGGSWIWKKLYPDPVYRKEITKMITNVIEEQAYLRNFETRIITGLGSEKYISWNTSEVRSPGGSITGYVAVGVDITDKVQNKRQLREREELFHGITSAAYNGIILLDEHSIITYWNPAAERIFFYHKQEAKGINVIDLLAPETARTQWQSVLTKTGSHELDARRKDGSLISAELNISRVMIKNRPHTIVIIRDMTEQKRSESQMRLLSTIVQTSQEAIVSISGSGTILSWNKAAEEMTGIPEESALDAPILDLIKLKDGEERIAEAISQSNHAVISAILPDRRGMEHDVIISVAPLSGGEGFSLLVRDITEVKKAQRTMIAYIREATARLKMPVEVVRENIGDILGMFYDDTIDCDAAALRLKVQMTHLAQIAETIRELNAALTGEGTDIPKAYEKFLLE